VDIVTQMNWRYAVKKFNENENLTQEQLQTIIECVRLSPSAFGLQPYRLILVEDMEKRRALGQHSMGNREKVINASGLLVFAIETSADNSTIDRYISLTSGVRGIPEENLVQMKNLLTGLLSRFPADRDYQAWARCQAYLALGNMLTVCAVIGVDACPMEGFVATEYDKVLGLNEQGLTTAVIAVVGKRAVNDEYGKLKKVRKSMDEFLIRI